MAYDDIAQPMEEQDEWRRALASLTPRPQQQQMMQARPQPTAAPALVNPTGTPQMPPESALKIPGNEGLKNDDALKVPSLTGALKTPDVMSQPSYTPPLSSDLLRNIGKTEMAKPPDLEPHGWRKALGLGLSALAGNEAGKTADEFLHGRERRYEEQQKEQGAEDYQKAQTEHLRAETANLGGGGEVPFTPFGETEPIMVPEKALGALEAAKQRATSTTQNVGTRTQAAKDIETQKETAAKELVGEKGKQAAGLETQKEAGAVDLEKLKQQGRMAVTEARGALQKDTAAIRKSVAADPNKLSPQMTAMKQTAQSLLPEIERIEPQIDKLAAQLGPGAGRWNDFWTGKIGAPNPEFATLRDELGFLETGVALAHARGRMSNIVFEHFQKMFDAGKQSPENLKAALKVAHQWMSDYSKMGTPEAPTGGVETREYQGRTYTRQPDGTWKAK
jgi:hypothetical protein